MSAYMVDRKHIRFLVHAALSLRYAPRFNGRVLNHNDATALGQMLWDENRKSINSRYPDCVGSDELPGEIGEDWRYEHIPSMANGSDPVAIIKACDCFDYQSCEHDGWGDSEAHRIIESIRGNAIHNLEGYEAAPWGAPDLDGRTLKGAGE